MNSNETKYSFLKASSVLVIVITIAVVGFLLSAGYGAGHSAICQQEFMASQAKQYQPSQVDVIYERTIEQVKADIQSFDIVEKSSKILDGKFILLKRYCSFYSYAQLHHEILGAIYPRDGQYHVRLSPTFKRKYETKIRFPEEWGGKSGQLLKDVSGISGACFCHSSRFLATFETERDAIKACELLAEENND
jgi:uncharacterized UPF0160 family protein